MRRPSTGCAFETSSTTSFRKKRSVLRRDPHLVVARVRAGDDHAVRVGDVHPSVDDRLAVRRGAVHRDEQRRRLVRGDALGDVERVSPLLAARHDRAGLDRGAAGGRCGEAEREESGSGDEARPARLPAHHLWYAGCPGLTATKVPRHVAVTLPFASSVGVDDGAILAPTPTTARGQVDRRVERRRALQNDVEVGRNRTGRSLQPRLSHEMVEAAVQLLWQSSSAPQMPPLRIPSNAWWCGSGLPVADHLVPGDVALDPQPLLVGGPAPEAAVARRIRVLEAGVRFLSHPLGVRSPIAPSGSLSSPASVHLDFGDLPASSRRRRCWRAPPPA